MTDKTVVLTRPPAVYSAIASVMGDLAKVGIGKDQVNSFDKYKFRGIDDVYNALAPLLSKHGLVILPRCLERQSIERSSNKGQALYYVTVDVEFDFIATEDGSKHTIRMPGEAMDRSDKATNKAMTAAYKYACFEVFCIPTEGDNDEDTMTPSINQDGPVATISPENVEELQSLMDITATEVRDFCRYYGIESLSDLPIPKYKVAKSQLERKHRQDRAKSRDNAVEAA